MAMRPSVLESKQGSCGARAAQPARLAERDTRRPLCVDRQLLLCGAERHTQSSNRSKLSESPSSLDVASVAPVCPVAAWTGCAIVVLLLPATIGAHLGVPPTADRPVVPQAFAAIVAGELRASQLAAADP